MDIEKNEMLRSTALGALVATTLFAVDRMVQYVTTEHLTALNSVAITVSISVALALALSTAIKS